jgi:glycosyltransferase involved in cell wall biosynthesis
MTGGTLVLVAARNEAATLERTLAALASAFPGDPVWVADDGSSDGTAAVAAGAGARVVSSGRRAGKGAAMTLAAREALAGAMTGEGAGALAIADAGTQEAVVLLCDGDLGESARRLGPLVELVHGGEADLAIADFKTKVGGGFGLALGFARWAIRRRCGLEARAALSGQRAVRAGALAGLLPFAAGYGMEVGMTIDAVRAGWRVAEIELELTHRATGRTPAGFAHRACQLRDIARASWQRH